MSCVRSHVFVLSRTVLSFVLSRHCGSVSAGNKRRGNAPKRGSRTPGKLCSVNDRRIHWKPGRTRYIGPYIGRSQSQPAAGLAEVVAVDGKGHGQRQVGRPAEDRPEQQAPVMETFAAKNAEPDIRVEECSDTLPVHRPGDPRPLVLAQERANPLVIRSG